MFDYDLAIIGGGPAGLAAATMALNARINFVLVAPDLGGKVNYGFSMHDFTTTESIWGAEQTQQLEERIRAVPDRHIMKTVSTIEREETGFFRMTLVGAQGVEQAIRASTVIVATGASPRRLHIDGEVEYWGRGLSYSTISHAGYMPGRDVAVIGFGARAMTASLRLAAIANHVYLIPTMTLSESDGRVAQIKKSANISLLKGWEPQRFAGDEHLKQVMLTHEREFRTLEVDAVFVELGLIPDKAFLRELVEFDPETGQIPINQLCETAVPGLYAAGDVTNIFAEQIPVAIGEGIKAALSAWEYLASNQ